MLLKKELEVIMPYIPEISVNSAYNRGDPKQGHKPEVDTWLLLLKSKVNQKLDNKHYFRIDKEYGVRLNILLKIKSRPGRKPDVSNFRKLPQDVMAACLKVDDSIFFGTDWALTKGEENEIVFTLDWKYSSNAKDVLDSVQTKLHNGLLSPYIRKRMGLGNDTFCIGLGTPYCMKCSAVVICPIEFNPDVYTEVPCKMCNIVCPCRALDNSYEERKQLIEQWWCRRNA